MHTIKISELSKLVGIATRKLRYVVDHRLVPVDVWELNEDMAGTPRVLDNHTACLVTAAAQLLEAGYKREQIPLFFEALETLRIKRGRALFFSPLELAFSQPPGKEIRIMRGDTTHIRCIIDTLDTGWYRSEKGKLKLDADFTPVVTIDVDFAKIIAMVGT